MVSERRRARLEAVQEQSDAVPEWLYEFPLNRWVSARKAAGKPVDFGDFVAERTEWGRRRDAWLQEHGVSEEAYERMQRARWARPDPPAA